MHRRTFLIGGTAVAVLRPESVTAACSNPCDPTLPDAYRGTDNRPPPLMPTVCTGDLAHDLMTLQWQQQWVRLTEFAWSYGLMYPSGGTEFYRVQIQNRRCFNHQRVHSGTRIILWMNCLSREDYQTWYRYWFATKPITDNGQYTLELYHVEPASSYEDKPTTVPRVQQFLS